MWWILGPFIALVAVGLVCCWPDLRFYLGLVCQAVREGRDKKPPLAGA